MSAPNTPMSVDELLRRQGKKDTIVNDVDVIFTEENIKQSEDDSVFDEMELYVTTIPVPKQQVTFLKEYLQNNAHHWTLKTVLGLVQKFTFDCYNANKQAIKALINDKEFWNAKKHNIDSTLGLTVYDLCKIASMGARSKISSNKEYIDNASYPTGRIDEISITKLPIFQWKKIEHAQLNAMNKNLISNNDKGISVYLFYAGECIFNNIHQTIGTILINHGTTQYVVSSQWETGADSVYNPEAFRIGFTNKAGFVYRDIEEFPEIVALLRNIKI